MARLRITTFGEHIRILRDEAQLSLKDVATRIGIDTSLLGKIERDERQPTREQLKLLADFFDMDEKILQKEALSDLIAYKIIEEEVDIDTLKVAEKKIEYLKKNR